MLNAHKAATQRARACFSPREDALNGLRGGLRPTVRARTSSTLRCAYCHDASSGTFLSCSTCGTCLHLGCWNEAGTCPSLGCAPRRRPPPAVVLINGSVGEPAGVLLNWPGHEPAGVLISRAAREAAVTGASRGSLASGAFGSLLCMTATRVVPAFSTMFLEVGVCLPAPTQFVIGVPSWGWCALSALSILTLSLKDRWLSPHRSRDVNLIYAALVVCAGFWLVHCLFTPLCVLMTPL